MRSRARWSMLRLKRFLGAYDGWLPGDPLPEGAIDCLTATNEHGVFCIPRSAARRTVPTRLLRSHVHEPATLELIAATDPATDIVHAGAFHGDFLPALSRSRRDATVWAFEPNRESWRCAMITCLLNDLTNVRLTNAGLGAQPGAAPLLLAGGTSRLVQSSTADSEQVRLVTIDELLEHRQVGLIHLDIEGHEPHALLGATETIERCLPTLVLETLPEPAWFDRVLRPLGYVLDGTVNGNHVIRADRA